MKSLTLGLALGAALIIAGGAGAEKPAFAPGKGAKPAPAAKSITCPVMKGGKVDMAQALKTKMYADYKGNRYFFCCAGCPDAFKKNPEKYAKGPHVPLPKPKKKA